MSSGSSCWCPPTPRTVGAWADLQARRSHRDRRTHRARRALRRTCSPRRCGRSAAASMPRARSVPISAMLTGRYDCDYVEIVGVVQRTWRASDSRSTRVMFADVATEDGVVRATFWDYAPEDLTRFIDARVRLRGNVGTIFGQTEQLRGVSLFAGRIRDMVVLEPAPDPFSLPARSSRNIYNYSSAGEVNRRIRVRGVVTARIPGRPVEVSDFTTTATFRYVLNVLYIKDATGGVRVETEQTPSVRPGSSSKSRDSRASAPGKPILRNAVFKVVGVDSRAAPADGLNPQRADARSRRRAGADGRPAAERADRPDRARPRAQGGRHGVQRRHRRLAGERTRSTPSAPGSLLSVTGVYSYQGGSASVVPALPAVRRTTCASWRRRRGGRCGTRRSWPRFWRLAASHRRVLDARGGEAEAPAVSGRADRAHEGRARAPRHRGAGARGHHAAARGRGREPADRAGGGAAVAGRRAADAALQPRGDEAIGDGPPVAGAREPRSCRAR